jgi:hypothetical protein
MESNDYEKEEKEKFLEDMKKTYINLDNFNTIMLFNSNDYQTCNKCLNFIYLICNDLGWINKKNIKIFCTACFYFMYVIRSGGSNYMKKFCYYNLSNFMYPIKSFLVNLCINCVSFSFKICKNKKLHVERFDNIFLIGKKNLNKELFPSCTLNDKDFEVINNLLRSDRIIGLFVQEFIFIEVDPLRLFKILSPFKELKNVFPLIKVYTNPNFFLFSTYKICLFLLDDKRCDNKEDMLKMFF